MHAFTNELLSLADEKYRDFSIKLIPDTNYSIIGVRAPQLKNFAKSKVKNQDKEIISFLNEKHTYHEEFLLHGLFLSMEKDVDKLIPLLNEFLPYVDNWAVCDCTVSALKLFKKHPEQAFTFAKECIKSDKPYQIRFGIICLLSYFLDNNFTSDVIPLVLSVKSSHYYVNMGLAWFFSVALIKQYDSTIGIFENKILPKFVHNKSIQKAFESFRVATDTKNFLRKLKIK